MSGDRLVILGMGGTIAGQADRPGDNVGYTAGRVSVGDLIARVPDLAPLNLAYEQVAQINSKDLQLSDWQRLVDRVSHHLLQPDVRGIVITHGTDTIEETAFLLQNLLAPRKPVVLTCAMRPASAISPDGPQNLSDAVAVARHSGAFGVTVVCAGRVHAADDVTKVHPYRIDPFDSGDAGAVACVEAGVLQVFRPWPHAAAFASRLGAFQRAAELPRVAWLVSHADAGPWQVDALLTCAEAFRPQGILVAGTGNGSLNQALQSALDRAQTAGVQVALASRCGGRVVPYPAQPFADRYGLTPSKARLALSLELLAA